MEYVDTDIFLRKASERVIFDVRSPAEYDTGHIPNAYNLPLFDDDERKQVGTLYKQSGREPAILAGLDFVGPKMSYLVREATRVAPGREVLIHCWRGGMRSAGMAWLLKTADFEVSLLEGGYKAYRRFIREKLGEPFRLIVLGGKTGSGKTEILHQLKAMGEQVIDLEQLAHHKGSAFGDLGQEKQPTSEQFENNLFDALHHIDSKKTLWIEDESQGIGTDSIPGPFYQQIRNSFLLFIDMPKAMRVKRLVKEYAAFEKSHLENAILRISKKLGGLNTRLAINALQTDDFETVADLLLIYYDKAYLKGLSLRDQQKVIKLSVEDERPEILAQILTNFYYNKHQNIDRKLNYESHLS